MKKNKVYLFLVITYFLVLITFLVFYHLDVDFQMTKASFINIIIVITLIYLGAFLGLFYLNYQAKQIKLRQLEILKNDEYLVDEYQQDEVIAQLYAKIVDLKQKISNQNEKQNSWVHDIKMPLTTLKLFVDNHRNTMKVEDSSLLDIIALDLENQINKKIMFDKIELGIDDYNIEPFNLNELINEVIKKFKANFFLKKIAVNIEMELVKINSDRRKIKYCLEQIILNATKYSYEQTTINIYFVNTCLIVENIGDTIDSQDINRLFEQGYTGKNAHQGELSSTGIGLYMTKKSLNYLNHDIFIESENRQTKVIIDFRKITKL